MRLFKPNCTLETTDKILVLEENKRKCIFSNPESQVLIKIIVDGCQITEGTRCDFLVLDQQKNEYFVELKGKDIPHAIEQLEATIKQLSSSAGLQKTAIIVSSRHPSNDTSIQRAKVLFKKKYKVDLISKNVKMEIQIK
ncbi:MAG: hypothetical protein KH897_19885 [Bacteroides sp.]|jgi:hypothetical protein|uniref:hypothetical protein n=1 Tax=Bacteroides sp. TaxID=29523 RepID=UPI0025B9B4F3|nr:hypothetical protein [Bacteroides sp.]MBS6240565.1 hypothetical protein [Bacteroides sp.]